jgi:hypothetical protein
MLPEMSQFSVLFLQFFALHEQQICVCGIMRDLEHFEAVCESDFAAVRRVDADRDITFSKVVCWFCWLSGSY